MSEQIAIDVETTVTLVEVTVAPNGIKGEPGTGMPIGGTLNQLPYKRSETDYDIGWTSAPEVTGVKFDMVTPDIPGVGEMAWNDADKTVNLGLTPEVTLQLGQESVAYARNRTGNIIANGTIVFVSGATGQNPEISVAHASNYAESIRVVAIATHDIFDNSAGFVTTFGVVRDIDTSAVNEGDMLYLAESGAFTNIPPAYPSNRVAIGVCLYSHAQNGKLFFYPRIVFRKFGDPVAGDYSGFNDIGYYKAYGGARAWRDEVGDAVSLRQQGAGVSQDPIGGAAVFAANADLNDFLYKNMQLNHDRDATSRIYPHLHFWQAEANMPNFLLQYRWHVNGQPRDETWKNLRCNIAAIPYTSGVLCQIATTEDGILPPANSYLSDIVQFRILRDNSNASGVFSGVDPYTQSVSILSFDVHIHVHSFGSSLQYA